MGRRKKNRQDASTKKKMELGLRTNFVNSECSVGDYSDSIINCLLLSLIFFFSNYDCQKIREYRTPFRSFNGFLNYEIHRVKTIDICAVENIFQKKRLKIPQ